jgi:hypothetical protein
VKGIIEELRCLREDAPLYQHAIDAAIRLCEREALVQKLLKAVDALPEKSWECFEAAQRVREFKS